MGWPLVGPRGEGGAWEETALFIRSTVRTPELVNNEACPEAGEWVSWLLSEGSHGSLVEGLVVPQRGVSWLLGDLVAP